MRTELPCRHNCGNNGVVEIAGKSLEPLEYCQRWVKIQPGERGYRKTCVNALAQATGLSPETIKNWGLKFEKRPDNVLHSIKQADILNQIRQLITSLDLPEQE